MRILLTGGRAPATLDLARILGRHTSEIFLAESLPFSISSFSRYIKKNYRVPPPRQEAEAFAQHLLEIVQKEEIDLIIPTCEEIFTVLAYEDLLRPCTSIFAPSHQICFLLTS